MRFVALAFLSLTFILALSVVTFSSQQRDFLVKVGIMQAATPTKDRLVETNEVTMDPSRNPGFCFLVDPPSKDPYEVYSIHYLPEPPQTLRGGFQGKELARAVDGIKTRMKRVDGIRPFCFDFHPGDPLGTYLIEVFINNTLKTTLRLEVVPPDSHSSKADH